MTDFRDRSRAFLRDVSKAAAWMMKANVSEDHWWRPGVLTDRNKTESRRPVFDPQTAEKIFEELKQRNLLVDRGVAVDGSSKPAYFMKYDVEGWDKAVSDGRPIVGALLKLNREWFLYLIVLLFGWVLAVVENRFVGLIESAIDALK